MNDRHANAAASSSATPPAMPALPDGVGLSYEELASRLAEKSRVIVSPDDPILMMVPLCNAFLEEERRLMERHKRALAQVMAEKTGGFVDSVKQITDDLGKTLTASAVDSLSAGLAAHRQGMERQNAALQQHQANIRWWGLVATVSALLNIVLIVFFLLHGR